MARRIIVVLSQSPNASPARRAIEEELATVLIMESGIDVNVIPHVEHLEPGSTGLLCLEGIVGDMVFVSWLDSSAAATALAKVGVTGRHGKTNLDRDDVGNGANQSTSGRRIYFLELQQQTAVSSLFDEIRRIRDDARVQTFDLAGVLPRVKTPATSGPAPQPAAEPKTVPAPSQSTDEIDIVDSGDEDDEMDRLVDELDAMDL